MTFDNKRCNLHYLSLVLGRIFFCVKPLNWTSIFCHQQFFFSIDRLVIVVCECWNIECWCVHVTFILLVDVHLYVCQFQFPLMISLWIVNFINRSISVEWTLLFKWSGVVEHRLWWRALGCNVQHKTIIFISCFVIITKKSMWNIHIHNRHYFTFIEFFYSLPLNENSCE